MNQWVKRIAQWSVGNTLYISVPFTWLVKEAEKIADNWKGKILMGGPGFMKPSHCDGFEPILFHNPCATFTSRGCVNNCQFCAVPKLEGDLKEIPDFRPAPVICDNNFGATSKKEWLDTLRECDQEVFVWRPDDIEEIVEVLRA